MTTRERVLYLATIIIVPGGLVLAVGHFLYARARKQHLEQG